MFKLSSEAILDGAVTVENKFIVEYMPYADGDYVKVYLYGLSLAARKSDPDDTIERLARRLDLDVATVNAAIDYWAERGLMSRLGDDIGYLSLRSVRPKIKKYDVDKYAEFNRQAQSYISARQIDSQEYREYYDIMERLDIEWQAMVLIVKYCVDIKGDNVSCPYILAVARNLAQDGYRSSDDVMDRLEEYGVYYNDLCAVLGVLPTGKKHPDHEAVQLYKKWKLSYKFDQSVIAAVAQSVKRGGMATLDLKLTQYHDSGFTTLEQIDGYETERRRLYKLAKAVNKSLGLYYENVDPEINNYIRPWLDMGMESSAISALADYCMVSGLKTLSDLDAVVRDFFAAGITTESRVKARFEHERRFDGAIEKLLQKLNIQGAVKPSHRAMYETWIEKWSMPDDVIEYAATLACEKANPVPYMNAILSAWRGAGVNTLDGAKSADSSGGGKSVDTVKTNTATVRERITAEQLNAMVIHLGEDDK